MFSHLIYHIILIIMFPATHPLEAYTCEKEVCLIVMNVLLKFSFKS